MTVARRFRIAAVCGWFTPASARAPARWTRGLGGPGAVLSVIVAAAAVAGAVSWAGVPAQLSFHGGFVDLSVYQYGGRLVIDGLPLYDARDPATNLRFTYPPFAAAAMAPLALVPGWLATGLWTGASVATLAGVIVIACRASGRTVPGPTVALLTVGAMALEPVWQNLTFGQINLLLMLAVFVDLVRPEQRWSGVLVGLAAGVKLTPLVFVVLLMLVGRRRAARRALLTFVATIAIGFLIAPTSATTYWTDGLVRAGRVGPAELAHNQSVFGALTRLLDGPPATLLWLAVAGPVTLAVLLVGAWWWRRGDRVLGTGLGALAMLLASPVSWSHHWVWAVPVGLALWNRSRWAGALWIAVFTARPFVWSPWGDRREYRWNLLEHIPGNAYLLVAVALTVYAAVTLSRQTGPPGRTSAQHASSA